jgi:hypothetical protein
MRPWFRPPQPKPTRLSARPHTQFNPADPIRLTEADYPDVVLDFRTG